MNLYVLLTVTNVLGLVGSIHQANRTNEGYFVFTALCWFLGFAWTAGIVLTGKDHGFPELEWQFGVLHLIGVVVTFGHLIVPAIPRCVATLGKLSKIFYV